MWGPPPLHCSGCPTSRAWLKAQLSFFLPDFLCHFYLDLSVMVYLFIPYLLVWHLLGPAPGSVGQCYLQVSVIQSDQGHGRSTVKAQEPGVGSDL